MRQVSRLERVSRLGRLERLERLGRLKPRYILRRAIPIIIFALLLSASVIRIIDINRDLPTPPRVEHELGEEIVGGDLSLSVTGATIDKGSRIESISPGYLSMLSGMLGEQADSDNTSLVMAEIEVANKSPRDMQFDFGPISLQTGARSNGLEWLLFNEINADDSADPAIIAGHSTKKLMLPYLLDSAQFKNKEDWQNVAKHQYELVVSFYPAYHVVRLGNLACVKG